ncbi:hypothetical protein B0H12DRAFT_356024 [Mycena haematopus]|nr:hypothetical protein B0H12DRAFT_356024 [Mycena haematopus]
MVSLHNSRLDSRRQWCTREILGSQRRRMCRMVVRRSCRSSNDDGRPLRGDSIHRLKPSLQTRSPCYAGSRIFEIANATPTLRHHLWSGLPHTPKAGNPSLHLARNPSTHGPQTRVGYDSRYQAEHLNAKGASRSSSRECPPPSAIGHEHRRVHGDAKNAINVRADGTGVFASQMEDSRMSMMMTLKDVGFWTRWIFDHRAETSGQDLNVASDMLDWDTLVATITRVTGFPAVHLRLAPRSGGRTSLMRRRPRVTRGDGSTTVKENYTRRWAL